MYHFKADKNCNKVNWKDKDIVEVAYPEWNINDVWIDEESSPLTMTITITQNPKTTKLIITEEEYEEADT